MSIVLNGTSGVTTNSGTLISASTIGVGGATPAASGAGISFPATQSDSTDANTLDDYEEGTWTPVPTAASGTITSYTSTGRYTKIGRTVICNCLVSITNNGTGATAGNIGGLPFTPASAGTTACTRDYAATGKMAIWQATAGSTSGAIYAVDGTYPWATGSTFNLSFCYQV